jgi:hypothetical protein
MRKSIKIKTNLNKINSYFKIPSFVDDQQFVEIYQVRETLMIVLYGYLFLMLIVDQKTLIQKNHH